MNNFVLVHAQFARRELDKLEVEFISNNELRYSKPGLKLIIGVETYINPTDLAPDGVYTFLTDLQLGSSSRAEVESDLNEAAIPLQTRFHFR